MKISIHKAKENSQSLCLQKLVSKLDFNNLEIYIGNECIEDSDYFIYLITPRSIDTVDIIKDIRDKSKKYMNKILVLIIDVEFEKLKDRREGNFHIHKFNDHFLKTLSDFSNEIKYNESIVFDSVCNLIDFINTNK